MTNALPLPETAFIDATVPIVGAVTVTRTTHAGAHAGVHMRIVRARARKRFRDLEFGEVTIDDLPKLLRVPNLYGHQR